MRQILKVWLIFLLLRGWTSIFVPMAIADDKPPKRWTNPEDFRKMSCEDRIAWAKKYLGPHLGTLRNSAERNRIPVRLLATVVLNEMSDYGLEDLIQEQVFSRGSVGIAQMNVERALRSGFMDDFITQKDLDEARQISVETPLGTVHPFLNIPRDYAAWKKLNDPAICIEVAARETSRILDVLSSNPRGTWARWFVRGWLDRNDLYRNIIPGFAAGPNGVPLTGKRITEWINDRREKGLLERFQEDALTVAVVAAYNTDSILTSNFNHTWIWNNPPKRIQVNPNQEPKKHPFYNARSHALNAVQIWSDCLHSSDWLEEFPPPPPVKKVFRDLVARDILVKESEIGEGFRFFHDSGTDDNSASVEFKNWDTGVSIKVYIQKKRDTAAHDRHRSDYEIMTRQKSTDSRYVVESLGLGESAYIIKTGKANFEAEAFPGRIWHLWVTGSYYSFSGDYEENASKVKTAVTNAITAMYNRVIELEGR